MQMDIMKREQQEGIRINKYLSEAGICSRRAADREIENGNVWINGRQGRERRPGVAGDEGYFLWERSTSGDRRNYDCFS